MPVYYPLLPILYNQFYDFLMYSFVVHSGNQFSDLSSKDLRDMSHSTVNAAF